MIRGQIRAARALLRWTADDLAQRSKVGLSTIKRTEAATGPMRLTAANAQALRQSLEAGGVEFIPEDDANGPGVRLRKGHAPD